MLNIAKYQIQSIAVRGFLYFLGQIIKCSHGIT